MPQALFKPDVGNTFVTLVLDGWRWLVPQVDIHSLEPLFDLTDYAGVEVADNALVAPDPVGLILLADESWPIYSLAGNFSVLKTIPETRRICILLRTEQRRWGLVCDQLEVLEGEQLRLQPIPECMAKPDSPLYALTSFGDHLAYVTTAAHLATYLQHGSQLQQEQSHG